MAMSPAKRAADSLGEEQSAESAIKRVKTEQSSAAHDNDQMEEDQSDGEDRDAMDDDTDLEDDEKNEAAYLRQKALIKGTLGLSPKAGFIKSVTLKNFMNHKYLTVTLCPKMNFLVGHNGSGKSAILTAIAIVLGAKASITGRGHAVKDLIKRGEDRAEISLTMANEEPGAFEHDKYGDNIIIDRTIDKSGASTYRFRAVPDGKILGSKREVITQICSHFDIDIDSPLTILTQDAAKSFLSQSDPHKLYAFFLRGTKLSDLADSYEKTRHDTNKIERQLVTAREGLPELQDRVEKMHRQVQAARKIGDMRLEFANTKVNLAWAYVIAMEDDAERLRTRLGEFEEKREHIEKELSDAQMNRGPLEEAHKQLAQEMKEHAAQRKPIQDEIKVAKKELDKRQTDLASCKFALSEVRSEIKSAEKEIASLEQQLEERNQTSATQDPRETELRKKNEQMEGLLSNMRRSIPVYERDQKNLQTELSEVEQKVDEAEGRRDNVKRDLESARQRLNQMQRSEKNRLEAFGTNIDLVLNEIKRTKWRHTTPIGPIGQYVKLKDKFYRSTIEASVGSLLCSFIVFDRQDNATLMDILKRCQSRGYQPPMRRLPQIIRFSGDLFDFRDGDLTGRNLGNASNVETVLSKLEITNDVVLRVLINTNRIERVLVAKHLDDANALIDNILVDPRAAPVTVLSGLPQPFQSIGKALNSKTAGPMAGWNAASLFIEDFATESGNVQQQIRQLEISHQDAVKEVSSLTGSRRSLQQKLAEVERNLDKARSGIPKLVKSITANKDEIERLQPLTGNALESFKDEREMEAKSLRTQEEELETSRKDLQAAFDEADGKLKTLTDQDHDFAPEKEKKDNAFRNLAEKIAKLAKAQEHWQSSLQRTKQDVDDQRRKVEKADADLVIYVEKAQQMGDSLGMGAERRVVDKTIEDLDNRRKALERQIAEAEQRSAINLEKAASDYNHAKANLERQQRAVHTFDKVSKMLKKNIQERMKRWELLRHHLAVRARTGFIQHLHTRNMDGALNFHHDEDALNINIESTGLGDTQAAVVRDKAPQELSGGERSYVTVCFLLALWDLMPSTIRCLDEWDVFLDAVNRQLAAHMLIEGARESSGKQYVLITPQDMGGVNTDGNDNRVIRLQDPTRNQTTLPF